MIKLDIYYTSDLHGYLYPTDYTNMAVKPLGLMAIGSNINKTPNTLIIDGGDTIQGSPLCNYYAEQYNQSQPLNTKHPVAQVMNLIGYDYMTLGNHDFNFGDAYLRSYLSDSNAQCLCSNVRDTLEDEKLIKSYDIRTMPNGLKVGIIGIATDHITIWERQEHLINFEITDPYVAAKNQIEKIKDQVDILIGLYHGGFENDVHTHQVYSTTTENIGYKLCESLEFDLLLTGHQHMAIPGHKLHDTHIVQTPSNGTMYAHIEIDWDNTTKNAIINSQLITPTVHPQATVNHYSTEYSDTDSLQEEVQKWLDIQVGTIDVTLMPEEPITMASKGAYLANFLNQVQLETSSADISCTSLGNHIKGMATNVSLRDIVSTYVFPNTLIVIRINGDQLKTALERCAEYFEIGTNDQLTVSETFLKPKVEHYNYDYFSGIDYTFDIRKPIGSRVIKMMRHNQPIKNTDTFTLVMNNYRATGTGGYEVYTTCPILQDLQIATADMVANYIKQNPMVVVDKHIYLCINE